MQVPAILAAGREMVDDAGSVVSGGPSWDEWPN
jgi:hypothetical protein